MHNYIIVLPVVVDNAVYLSLKKYLLKLFVI